MNKKKLLGFASVVVSAGLVVWLLSRVDGAQVLKLWRQSNKAYLGLAVGLTILTPLFATLRWLGVLRAQGVDLSFVTALRAVLMANVLNSLLPSKGGDIVKATYLRAQGGLTLGVGSVVLERLIDLLVLGLLGLGGYLVSGVRWGLWVAGLLLGAVTLAFVFALFFPAKSLPVPVVVRNKLFELSQVFRAWIRCPAAVAQTAASSLMVWSAAALTVCCLVSAFALPLRWSAACALFPLCILAGLVPATVSGVGTRDAVFVQLLTFNGATLEGATMVALGYTVFAYWLLSLLSLPAVGWQLLAYRRRSSVPAAP